LKAQSVNMLGETAQVQLNNVSFSNVLACLDELQQTAHIRVSAAKFISLAPGDQVDASLILHQVRMP
ncbi:MAG: type II secretion system protein GspM, partial [Sideroxydans sp.]